MTRDKRFTAPLSFTIGRSDWRQRAGSGRTGDWRRQTCST